jgi:uncharacterized protein with von Willebrand factor type A (vWA) domain
VASSGGNTPDEPSSSSSSSVRSESASSPVASSASDEAAKKNLDTILLESIDQVFSLVGEPAKSTIYSTLKEKHNVPFDEIPFKIEEFSKALKETFGSNAAIFEQQIIQVMSSEIEKLAMEPLIGDNLIDIMKNHRQSFQQKNRSPKIRLND